MFDEIYSKIKIISTVFFLLTALASLIFGLYYMFEFDDFWIGLLIIVGGVVSSWLISVFVYAFGELIERVTSIDYKLNNSSINNNPIDNGVVYSNEINTSKNISVNPMKAEEKPVVNVAVVHKWRCSNCNSIISENTCPYCGHQH